MRVLVCGGRDYSNRELVDSVLDELKPDVVIEGGARGADTLAAQWARRNGICGETYLAAWRVDGKRAGILRNQRMLDEGRPDLVVAFPGGRGTADMVHRAKKAGVTVRMLYEIMPLLGTGDDTMSPYPIEDGS